MGDTDGRTDDEPGDTGHRSLRAIASELGVSVSTAHRYADREPDADGYVRVGWSRGVNGRLFPDRQYDTTERDAEIVRRREDGETIRAIASAVGCSTGTVHRILKRDT